MMERNAKLKIIINVGEAFRLPFFIDEFIGRGNPSPTKPKTVLNSTVLIYVSQTHRTIPLCFSPLCFLSAQFGAVHFSSTFLYKVIDRIPSREGRKMTHINFIVISDFKHIFRNFQKILGAVISGNNHFRAVF